MDFGAGVGGQVHLHHVKTGINFLLRAQKAQPVEQAYTQQTAFGSIHHAHGGTTAVSGGTFYLHRHQGVTMAAHKVKLTAFTPAPVTAQHFKPLRAQVRGSHQLTVCAHAGGIRRGIRAPRAAPFVQQAQTSGDGVA